MGPEGEEMLMRTQWVLLAMLICAVPASANADESSATADARPSARGMDFDVYIRLRKGMTEELALLAYQEQQRLDIINQSIRDLGPTAPTGGGGHTGHITPTAYADGGAFDGPIIINEPGSSGLERVNIGSTSFGSNTAALVIPFGSGNVDANKGGGQPIQIYNTWQIQGGNSDQIVNLAIGKMQDMLEAVIKR